MNNECSTGWEKLRGGVIEEEISLNGKQTSVLLRLSAITFFCFARQTTSRAEPQIIFFPSRKRFVNSPSEIAFWLKITILLPLLHPSRFVKRKALNFFCCLPCIIFLINNSFSEKRVSVFVERKLRPQLLNRNRDFLSFASALSWIPNQQWNNYTL